MKGTLPDAVRWRLGKEHLGWAFTMALAGHMGERLCEAVEEHRKLLQPYVDVERARAGWLASHKHSDDVKMHAVFSSATLARWLHRHARRPVADTSVDRETPGRHA